MHRPSAAGAGDGWIRAGLGTLLFALAFAAAPALARHGGTYRGPPAGIPGPGPATGSGPGPTGPVTGGGLRPTGPVTGGGLPDATHWGVWWGFNKDPYLDLKRAIHTARLSTGGDDPLSARAASELAVYRPSPEIVRARVAPALERILAKERAQDLASGASIAFARIAAGDDELAARARPHLLRLFRSANQEIAETATVALGVLGDPQSIETLAALLEDGAAGRELSGAQAVTERTRAFAAFGLGLIGRRASSDRTRQLVARALTAVLEREPGPRGLGTEVETAAVVALGIVPVDPARGEGRESALGWTSRQGELRLLHAVAADPRRRDLVRAQAVTSLARLSLDLAEDARAASAKRVLAFLREGGDLANEIRQSAAQALGGLADCDGDAHDVEIRARLEALSDGGDEQVRAFALVALGRIAGRPGLGEDGEEGARAVRELLLARLVREKQSLRAWSAIALGIAERAVLERGGAGSEAVRAALQARLAATADDGARAYLCVALGMVGASDAIAPIEKLVRESRFRPALLREAATGLGLLGDKTLVPELARELGLASSQASQASIAQALGAIGDQRALEPLLALLEDEEATDSARGFAAVALGLVCDPEPLPWVARYSIDLNYRASTATLLAGNGTGLLEIL